MATILSGIAKLLLAILGCGSDGIAHDGFEDYSASEGKFLRFLATKLLAKNIGLRWVVLRPQISRIM